MVRLFYLLNRTRLRMLNPFIEKDVVMVECLLANEVVEKLHEEGRRDGLERAFPFTVFRSSACLLLKLFLSHVLLVVPRLLLKPVPRMSGFAPPLLSSSVFSPNIATFHQFSHFRMSSDTLEHGTARSRAERKSRCDPGHEMPGDFFLRE
jgi:hypothetical protein